MFSECPSNFISFEGFCYKKLWKSGTAKQVEKLCEKEGGKLAHFQTVEEFRTLKKFLKKHSK